MKYEFTIKTLKDIASKLKIAVPKKITKAELINLIDSYPETVSGLEPDTESSTETPKTETETPKAETPKKRAKLTLDELLAMIPNQDHAVVGGKEIKITTTDTAKRKAVKYTVGKFWVIIDRMRIATNVRIEDEVLVELGGDWSDKYRISRLPLTTENAHKALAYVYLEASKSVK